MFPIWFLQSLMLLTAAGFIILPVFRAGKKSAPSRTISREAQNIHLYRLRLAEFDQDLQSGIIDASELPRLTTELQRELLKDVSTSSPALPAREPANHAGMLVLVLGGFLTAVSLSFYAKLGSGKDLVLPELIAEVKRAKSQPEQLEAMAKLAPALDSRYQRRKDDLQNGYMLGTLYMQLQYYPSATVIFSQMAARMGDSPDKAMVTRLMERSRVLATQGKALLPASTINPGGTTAEASTGSKSVTVHVAMDPAIGKTVDPQARLFVFARSDSAPMPLAARTFALSELPLTITLDDSMAMTPQFRLSSARNVYVGARISKSAQAQPGDFEALSEQFVLGDQSNDVTLLIKDALP